MVKITRARAALAAGLLSTFLLGCYPLGTKTTVVSMGGGSVPTFVLPSNGASLADPTELTVFGEGIDAVRFEVDGGILYEDTAAPFGWTLVPSALGAGSHELSVSARRDQQNFVVTIDFSVPTGASPTPVPDPNPPVSDPPVEDPPPVVDPAPTTPDPIGFVLPSDGATVSAPTVLLVLGDGIESAAFLVDSAVVSTDFAAPFEWTLDPQAYSNGAHEIRVEATRAGATESRTVNLLLSSPVEGTGPTGDVARDIAALRAGQWYEIPNSHLIDVAPNPLPDGSISGVIGAWSSGAYDTKRDRLIVWGGGHGDYSGNEIYAFSLKTFTWTRVTDPSPFWPGDPNNSAERTQHPDGSPITRHTYDYLDYIPPPVDRFFCGGGAVLWRGGQFGDETTYLFDFDAKKWSAGSDDPSRGTGSTCAVAPDGTVWQHGAREPYNYLSAYDPVHDVWTKHAVYKDGWFGYARGAGIEPRKMKYVVVGAGDTWVWDLLRPDESGVRLSTRGDTGAEDSNYPGIDFDQVTGRMVCWNGGAGVYSLDLDTATWTRHNTQGVGTTPPGASGSGTNGRWRYAPNLNLFVCVNGVRENVFVYRHAER